MIVWGGAERPIHLILVPGRVAAARLLEQRLVVVDANALDAHELGGDAAEALGQDEAPAGLVVVAQAADLEKGLAVGVALAQGAGLPGPAVDLLPDGGAVGVDRRRRRHRVQPYVAVLPVACDLLGGQRVGAVEAIRRTCHAIAPLAAVECSVPDRPRVRQAAGVALS